MTKFYNPFSEKKIDFNNLRNYRDFLQVDKNYLNKNSRCFTLESVERYSGVAKIIVDGIHFNTLIIPSKSNKLYVSLTSGHRNTDIRFVRWKYANFLDGTFLAIDDPMFREFKNIPSDLMGWFYGTENNNFLLKTGLIIEKIASVFNIPSQKITIIGSSSGGYAATYLGNHVKNCSIIALNPQFILNKWPFAKKLEKVTGLDFSKDDDRNYVNISKSENKFFFYFNLLSKNDLPQINYLLNQFNLKIDDLKYGVNLISKNVAVWINIIDYYNLHIACPEVYEIMYINYLLNLMNNNININEFNSFSILLSEMMNQRYQVMNKVYNLTVENNNNIEANNILLKKLYKIEKEHWSDKKFSCVLDDFKTIFKCKYFNCNYSQFMRTRSAVTKVYSSSEEEKAYWNSLSNDNMKTATDIGLNLKRKTISLSSIQKSFNKFIKLYLNSPEAQNTYRECFEILSSAIYESPTIEYQDINPTHQNHIIVSSFFVRSGSSALYDYLSEFSSVQLIPGEFSILESSGAFAGFVRNKDNPDFIINHSIDFFFRNLLGCYVINEARDFKEMYVTNRFAENNNYSSRLLNSIKDMTKCLANLIAQVKRNGFPDLYIKKLGTAILNYISINVPADKIPLIDNSIHVHNIDIVNYVDNIKLACVSRDPRASYTSRIIEENGYIEPPESFIKSYTKIINLIRKKIATVDKYSLDNKIVALNFEYLVTSEKARKYILNKLNINHTDWTQPHSRFKPDESMKNVELYTTYQDQVGINTIRNSLPDYCFDLCNVSDENVEKGEYSINHIGTNKLFTHMLDK